MANDFFTLHCPDPTCQHPNPDFATACQRCGATLQRRYLWVVGEGCDRWAIGDTVGSLPGNGTQPRYAVVAPRIVLDTQPALLPDSPLDISLEMEPYLRLSHHRLAVPQIYGVLSLGTGSDKQELLLLERAPLQTDGVTSAMVNAPVPLPRLVDQWTENTALRQLNWLWQMAMLWTDLIEEHVATTLLRPEHLRVEGDIVRLLELTLDRRTMPTLADLGGLWQQWLPTTHADIQDFLTELCQQLTTRQVSEATALVQVLDAALHQIGRLPTRQIDLATQTDQGPTRKRNEDACQPPTGTVWSLTNPGIDQTPLPLVIVCDGIGGHEGGNVASGLAIATVQTYLQTALHNALPPASVIIDRMEQAVLAANDEIAQRNDQEKRHERQRMGTTLVMALLQHHEVYVTHVGDSRAYRITRSNCHQVTLDDDLASREARLGYALYRHALQKPASGALIQALGMGGSTLLHPSTSRFVLDEDCLFLLCSDGLSDRDLIDRIWQTDLLPVLDGTLDVAVAAQRLVAIANSQNGHDNVTVGLIHCQVGPPASTHAPVPADLISTTLDQSLPSPAPPTRPPAAADPPSPQVATQVISPPTATKVIPLPKSSRRPLLSFLGVLGLWAIGCGLAYLLLPNVRLWADTLRGTPLPSDVSPAPDISPTPPISIPESPASPTALPLDRLIQVNRATLDAAGKSLPINLLPQPTTPTAVIPQVLPVGTVLQISSRQTIPQRGAWLKIKVCTVPDEVPAQANVPSPGSSGWVAEAEIVPLVNPTPTVTPTQAGSCGPAASPTVPLIPPPTP